MTLKECYAELGGDYNDAMSRLYDENFIKMFVLKFRNDKNYENLKKYLEDGDHAEAFRAAHTLKGVSLNMSFTALAKTAGEMTESLRNGIKPEAAEIFERVTRDYNMTVEAIEKYEKSSGIL